MKPIAITAGALAMMATAALAQDAAEPNDEAPVAPWTLEELVEVYPEVTPELFPMIDTDGDGLVSQEEFDQAVESGLITQAL